MTCQAPNAQGRIDAHGGLFLACSACRLMSFGWNAQAVWSYKAVSEMILASPELRATIRDRAAALAEQSLTGTFTPKPAPAPAPEVVPTTEVEAA
jgi:hypothetical protein